MATGQTGVLLHPTSVAGSVPTTNAALTVTVTATVCPTQVCSKCIHPHTNCVPHLAAGFIRRISFIRRAQRQVEGRVEPRWTSREEVIRTSLAGPDTDLLQVNSFCRRSHASEEPQCIVRLMCYTP